VLSSSPLKADHPFTSSSCKRHKANDTAPYTPGYISIKVSLSDHDAATLITLLQPLLTILEDKYICLHDLDIATDCQYVTSRELLEAHSLTTIPDLVEIVQDRTKVGEHCLSWIMDLQSGTKLRCKVYNKLVQMLESAEVRSSFGSRMEDLVANASESMTDKLLQAKNRGYTRLEVTFYNSKVKSYGHYSRTLDMVKGYIKDCPTYSVSYKAYWKYMTGNISCMIGIYIPKSKTFAYCHWYNSVTGRKYGSHRSNIGRDEMMTLLANYSFNDRPIYLLEADSTGTNIASMTTYRRADGCRAMTLVAGANKGLYLFMYNPNVLAFKDLGLGTSHNVTIKWPKSRICKGAAPLATIIKQDTPEDETGYIEIQQAAIHRSSFKHDHVQLEENKGYTIVALAHEKCYGNMVYFATTSSGLKIRCGRSLDALVDKWLKKYPSGKAPYLTFTTRKITSSSGGYRDIQVK
ncbi:hypothetical protein BGZ83_003967, partial [Gryganskiella cystojenkinii]